MKTIRLKSIIITIGDDSSYELMENLGFQGFESRKLKNYIGVSFGLFGFEKPEKDLKIEVITWDLGLDEQFRIVRKSYFKNASLAMILLNNPNKEQMKLLSNTVLEVVLFLGCIPIIILDPQNIASNLISPTPDNVKILSGENLRNKLEDEITTTTLCLLNGKNIGLESKCIKNVLEFIDSISMKLNYNPYMNLAEIGIKEILELYERNIHENILYSLITITKLKKHYLETLLEEKNIDLKVKEFFSFLLDFLNEKKFESSLEIY